MEACARIATRQKGIAARRQLLAAGLRRHVIDYLAGSGFLHPIFRGVYAVGHLALPAYAREQAALLACGEPALIVDRSALHLWGILEASPSEVHVAPIGHHCRKRQGIHLHRPADIDSRDIRRRHGLPVTSPARTAIDLAATAAPQELEDAVAEMRARRLVKDRELEAALQRAGRIPGAAAMRAFLKAENGPSITRSVAERHFRRYLNAAHLPQPQTNQPIAGYNADFLWHAEKVVLEIDSWQFHGHRRAFERDRRKDMALADAGYHVIRVTWRQFTEEPLALIAHIARALDRRARTPH